VTTARAVRTIGVMPTVGVCEDDPFIRRVLQEALGGAGHTVLLARDGGEAIERFSDDRAIDVLLLDIGLPDADGRDVCQALRAMGQRAPVLFLTARSKMNDIVTGFRAGGDDYVTKPFALAEVLVRVEALARRAQSSPEPESGLRLDPRRFSVRSGAAEVALTPTEFRMMAVLAAHPGDVIRRRDLVSAAWPDGAMVQENTIDSYVRRLRTKLSAVDPGAAIDTVRGVGYVLR
jgi:two-component system, OmpR family, response regulator